MTYNKRSHHAYRLDGGQQGVQNPDPNIKGAAEGHVAARLSHDRRFFPGVPRRAVNVLHRAQNAITAIKVFIRRRMTQWKKQLTDGDVFVIDPDLFGEMVAQNMMNQTFLRTRCAAKHGLPTDPSRQPWHHEHGGINFRRTVKGMQVFYVKQPDGEQVVQPNRTCS